MSNADHFPAAPHYNDEDASIDIGFEHEFDGEKFYVSGGKILVLAINAKEQTSTGGIVLPEATNDSQKNNYLAYGWVIGCGPYRDFHGRLLKNAKGWPMPQGSLVVHEMLSPMYRPTRLGHVCALFTHHITAWYLPDQWPEWALHAKKTLARKFEDNQPQRRR